MAVPNQLANSGACLLGVHVTKDVNERAFQAALSHVKMYAVVDWHVTDQI